METQTKREMISSKLRENSPESKSNLTAEDKESALDFSPCPSFAKTVQYENPRDGSLPEFYKSMASLTERMFRVMR